MTKYKIQFKDSEGNLYYPNTLDSEALPIGTMLPYSSKIIPNGFLPCDGSAVSRTEYAELFKIIGTSYGAGDGTTTFNLPDKRGKLSVGLDFNQTEFNSIGKKGGEKTHTLTLSEIIQHDLWTCNGDYNPNIKTAFNSGSSLGITTHNKTNTQPHNNLQPYEVDQWIIKAFNGAYNQPVSGDVNDTLPVGGIIRFDGDYIPEGYEEVENPENTYSLEEKIIGTWIDGKPLYRRMFDFGTLPNNSISSKNHNIANIKHIHINLGETFWCLNSTPYEESTGLSFSPLYTSYINVLEVSKTIITTHTVANATNYHMLVCLEYTKTTD